MVFVGSFMFYSSLTLANRLTNSNQRQINSNIHTIICSRANRATESFVHINRSPATFLLCILVRAVGIAAVSLSNEQKTQIKSTSICIFILLFSFRSFRALQFFQQFSFSLYYFFVSYCSNSIKFYIFPAALFFFCCLLVQLLFAVRRSTELLTVESQMAILKCSITLSKRRAMSWGWPKRGGRVMNTMRAMDPHHNILKFLFIHKMI